MDWGGGGGDSFFLGSVIVLMLLTPRGTQPTFEKHCLLKNPFLYVLGEELSIWTCVKTCL